MKRCILFLAALVMIHFTATVQAQEISWRSAAPPTLPDAGPVSLGRPITAPPPSAKFRGKIMDDVPGPVQEKLAAPMIEAESSTPHQPGLLDSFLGVSFLPPMRQPAAASTGWFAVEEDGVMLTPDGVVLEDCGQCWPCQRFYGSAEYINWWTRGQRIPPLVTTGSPTTPEDIRGALGAPGTQILFGGDRLDPQDHSGGRFTLGYWFDPCCVWAVEGSYFFLGQAKRNFSANSNQFPVLARPFFNINTGMQDRQLTASPGTSPGDAFKLVGGISVELPTSLQGAELNLKYRLYETCSFQVNVLGGFRYLDLHDGVHITENGTSLQAVEGTTLFNPGTQFIVRDSFDTRNQFYGGQLGVGAEWRRDRWFLEGHVKVALGDTHQSITINGSQTFIAPSGDVTRFTGGLLAVPSNIGHFTRDRFSVVPEVGLKLGYQVNDNVRVFVGYDFLYWSDVVRAGDQIDTIVNVTQVPNFCQNPAFCPPNPNQRPAVLFRTSNFWAQGVSAGIEVRY